MKGEILNIISKYSEEHYEEIKEKLGNNAIPVDFFYESSEHYFNTCKKSIRKKNIIDIKAIQNSLKDVTHVIYNFSLEYCIKLNNRYLKYPTSYFTYLLSLCSNFEELYNTITSVKTILDEYQKLFTMDVEAILHNDNLKKYIDFKKLKENKPYIYFNNSYYSELTKDYNEHFTNTLINIFNKSGVYFLYDDDKNLIYIGKSYNLGERVLTSSRERDAQYCSYSIIDNKVDTDIYEIYYIGKYKPILNATNKNEDTPTIKLKDLKFCELIKINK